MSAYETILDALQRDGCKVLDREPKARAQCPVHRSTGLTLSVRRFNDRAAVHCFAGCEDTDVLAELGLSVRDLFDGDLPPGYTPPPRRVPTPWDPITRGPGVEHLLHRIAVEHALEADPGLRDRARAQGEDCAACRGVSA